MIDPNKPYDDVMREKTPDLWETVIKDMEDTKLATEEIEEILQKHSLTDRELLLAVWHKVKQ